MRVFDIISFGAIGDGRDDSFAIQLAFNAATLAKGCLYIPPGCFSLRSPITQSMGYQPVAIRGEGTNVSILQSIGGRGILALSFAQSGIAQPWGLTMEGVGLRAIGKAETALSVSYGNPNVTNDHYQPSTVIRNVSVTGDGQGSFQNGMCFEAAWNVNVTDCYISGDAYGANWNQMNGNGIEMKRMCVNSHFTNVKVNFFANGFFYNAAGGSNTEGLFFTNCSMVAVKQGVWIIGTPSGVAPRVSTVVWIGGMIECRVGGVTNGGSAAFHFQNVWTALIDGCQMITETLPNDHTTYGIFIDNCNGIVVSDCDINAWHYGVFTVGTCKGINLHGNTYTNTRVQTQFNGGTSRSRSYGHTCVTDTPLEIDGAGGNQLGFV